MEMFLIGAVVGVGFTLLTIFTEFKVKGREWWERQEREMEATHTCAEEVAAENLKLRVAFAAAEMTQDGSRNLQGLAR